jgi:hypothetical protein
MANSFDTQNIRSINGANALVKKDGVILGYATGVNVAEMYALQRIDVLGEAYSRDIEPIGVVVQVAIGFIRMINKNGYDNDVGGGGVAKGLVPKVNATDNIKQSTQKVTDFFQQGFDLEIMDSITGTGEGSPSSRYLIQGCRPSAQSFALSRGTLMGINVTCEALRLVEVDA